MTKISFLGDLIPFHVCEINISPIIISLLKDSEYSIANLEAPLTLSNFPILKTGENFSSQPETVRSIVGLGLKSVCLANNHILDYGSEGLRETLTTLVKNNIQYFGADYSLNKAANPIVFKKENIKIAFINACESEFSIATKNSPGANPFDLISIITQLNELRAKCDYIFLIYHGGLEYYPLPTPNIRKTMRFLIDIGFDGIICHHPHVFGAFEYYKDKPIFYSLGNFFSPSDRRMPDDYYKSAIVTLSINDNRITHKLFPIQFSNAEIREMKRAETEEFIKKSNSINEILLDDIKFEKYWSVFLETKKYYYSNIISRFSNRFIKKLRKLNIFPHPSYKSKRALQLLNVMRCESHRETLISILEEENNSKL